MGRNSSTPDISPTGDDSLDPSHHSIRDRFPFKRNPNPNADPQNPNPASGGGRRCDRHGRTGRAHLHRSGRKSFKSANIFYIIIVLAMFVFVLGPVVLQSSIASVFRVGGAGGERRGLIRRGLKFGTSLKFLPSLRFAKRVGLDRLRADERIAVRPLRIALILGNMKKDPGSLMLFTVMKNLQGLGYISTIFAVEDGEARSAWDQLGGRISILNPERFGHIDWSIFEGIIVDSLEARDAISSLMQEPFCSIPLIWIIQENTLANRLPLYEEMKWEHLISYWRNSFMRADVVVFPDFSLPVLYSILDTGNFLVIPGSPKDVWSAEGFSRAHSKHNLRLENGFNKDDVVVLVVGSSFFFNELSWDYAVAMHDIGPLLSKYARRIDATGSFRFVFLCGNSTNEYNDELQEVAKHLRLKHGALRHYGMDIDVNGVLLMADIVLYGSSQDEQGFPSLLSRAMSFGLPVIAPDFPVIKKYMVDGVHGIIFPKHNTDALVRGFSLLISNGKLSKFARTVASSGRLLAKNMLAAECINDYAKLLETILNFPSDALLPLPISQLPQAAWDWNLFRKNVVQQSGNILTNHGSKSVRKSHIVYALEEGLTNLTDSGNVSWNESKVLVEDVPTELDWNILQEIESSEDYRRREMEEIDERLEKNIGSWDEIYRSARKAEKLKFEANERDEGELQRTGQPLCIYEIYEGMGAWPFLHHGSMYRGLSLSTRSRRSKLDDVDAVGRLPILNVTYYRDILCEVGGMFSLANRIDNIHKRPWIGFQSWHAAGRKLSLSINSERVLEEMAQNNDEGDTIYFWVRLDMDGGLPRSEDALNFWSMCDIFNRGLCRTAFENAFRRMYALPSSGDALPPMPEDGGYWSALHSWVMPTPSFLEFMMFSRMFVDSLHELHTNSSSTATCLLGSSELEKKHCYCRVMELLVNVWAYHSGRKMVYINPRSGTREEQHPVKQRKGFMWARYFNITLLKHMDEDLAEAADDGDHPSEAWLWPLTGEVHWQGIYEKERIGRYRAKMEKKRKTKEKLQERQQHGYRQKPLGR